MKGVAGGLDVHCEGVCRVLLLPVVNERMGCVDQSVLWYGVEETD